jgi:hypothetical protein
MAEIYDPQTIDQTSTNDYLRQILHPESAPLVPMPDLNDKATVVKPTMIYSQLSGASNYVIVFQPGFYPAPIRIGRRVLHPDLGTYTIGWVGTVGTDQDFSTNYCKGRVLACAATIDSQTMSTGNIAFNGVMDAAHFQGPVDFNFIDPLVMSSFDTPDALVGVKVMDGIRAVYPTPDSKICPLLPSTPDATGALPTDMTDRATDSFRFTDTVSSLSGPTAGQITGWQGFGVNLASGASLWQSHPTNTVFTAAQEMTPADLTGRINYRVKVNACQDTVTVNALNASYLQLNFFKMNSGGNWSSVKTVNIPPGGISPQPAPATTSALVYEASGSFTTTEYVGLIILSVVKNGTIFYAYNTSGYASSNVVEISSPHTANPEIFSDRQIVYVSSIDTTQNLQIQGCQIFELVPNQQLAKQITPYQNLIDSVHDAYIAQVFLGSPAFKPLMSGNDWRSLVTMLPSLTNRGMLRKYRASGFGSLFDTIGSGLSWLARKVPAAIAAAPAVVGAVKSVFDAADASGARRANRLIKMDASDSNMRRRFRASDKKVTISTTLLVDPPYVSYYVPVTILSFAQNLALAGQVMVYRSTGQNYWISPAKLEEVGLSPDDPGVVGSLDPIVREPRETKRTFRATEKKQDHDEKSESDFQTMSPSSSTNQDVSATQTHQSPSEADSESDETMTAVPVTPSSPDPSEFSESSADVHPLADSRMRRPREITRVCHWCQALHTVSSRSRTLRAIVCSNCKDKQLFLADKPLEAYELPCGASLIRDGNDAKGLATHHLVVDRRIVARGLMLYDRRGSGPNSDVLLFIPRVCPSDVLADCKTVKVREIRVCTYRHWFRAVVQRPKKKEKYLASEIKVAWRAPPQVARIAAAPPPPAPADTDPATSVANQADIFNEHYDGLDRDFFLNRRTYVTTAHYFVAVADDNKDVARLFPVISHNKPVAEFADGYMRLTSKHRRDAHLFVNFDLFRDEDDNPLDSYHHAVKIAQHFLDHFPDRCAGRYFSVTGSGAEVAENSFSGALIASLLNLPPLPVISASCAFDAQDTANPNIIFLPVGDVKSKANAAHSDHQMSPGFLVCADTPDLQGMDWGTTSQAFLERKHKEATVIMTIADLMLYAGIKGTTNATAALPIGADEAPGEVLDRLEEEFKRAGRNSQNISDLRRKLPSLAPDEAMKRVRNLLSNSFGAQRGKPQVESNPSVPMTEDMRATLRGWLGVVMSTPDTKQRQSDSGKLNRLLNPVVTTVNPVNVAAFLEHLDKIYGSGPPPSAKKAAKNAKAGAALTRLGGARRVGPPVAVQQQAPQPAQGLFMARPPPPAQVPVVIPEAIESMSDDDFLKYLES